MDENELKVLVARVSKDVLSEVTKGEAIRGLKVGELKDRAAELGGGRLDSAWTISYSTANATLIERLDPASVKDAVAWTISYSTAKISAVEGGRLNQ
ncbi:hypothetical protein ACKFKG_20140 [Phormidesmis sp. 146-35]